jgi:hypothetical protein
MTMSPTAVFPPILSPLRKREAVSLVPFDAIVIVSPRLIEGALDVSVRTPFADAGNANPTVIATAMVVAARAADLSLLIFI